MKSDRNTVSTLTLAALFAFGGCSSQNGDSEPAKSLPLAMQSRLDRLMHQVKYTKGATLLGQLREISAFGSYATQPVIDELLLGEDVKLRAGAVFVLGEIDRLDGDERAREAIENALSDSDRSVRLEAARALLESGNKVGTDLLVDALDDPQRGVRIRAYLALSQAAGERYGYNPDAEAAVRQASAVRFREHFSATGGESPPVVLPDAPLFVPAAIAPHDEIAPIVPTAAPESTTPSIPDGVAPETGSTGNPDTDTEDGEG